MLSRCFCQARIRSQWASTVPANSLIGSSRERYGYCGRPRQQDCPHPNACLMCPDFRTTVQFLPVHRQQAEHTAKLVEAARSAGHQRLGAWV